MKTLIPQIVAILIGLSFIASVFEHRKQSDKLIAMIKASQKQTEAALDQADLSLKLREFWELKYVECVNGQQDAGDTLVLK